MDSYVIAAILVIVVVYIDRFFEEALARKRKEAFNIVSRWKRDLEEASFGVIFSHIKDFLTNCVDVGREQKKEYERWLRSYKARIYGRWICLISGVSLIVGLIVPILNELRIFLE